MDDWKTCYAWMLCNGWRPRDWAMTPDYGRVTWIVEATHGDPSIEARGATRPRVWQAARHDAAEVAGAGALRTCGA